MTSGVLPNDFGLGTRVAFRRAFLRDLGLNTGWHPFARGEIIQVVYHDPDYTMVSVRWDAQETVSARTSNVNLLNLVREDAIHLEEP